MRRAIPLVLLLGGAFACQNYTFSHISARPVLVSTFDASVNAAPGTPYIMLVQDMSGSMCEPISADGGITDSGPGAGDCSDDPETGSKIGLVSTNMGKVLNALLDGGAPAPFYVGLTTFPGPGDSGATPLVEACAPPQAPAVPIAIDTIAIPQINRFYSQAIGTESGGTPTAAALSAAASYFPSVTGNISKYILLLTDGLPNCDLLAPCVINNVPWSDGKAHGCMSPTASAVQMELPAGAFPPDGGDCSCSYGSCTDPTGPGAENQCCFADPWTSAPGQLVFEVAAAQCLDDVHTIQVASQLHQQGFEIYVIGLGEDFNNFTLLDQIAQAGQGNSAAVHLQANDEQSLLSSIQKLINQFVNNCDFNSDALPVDGGLVVLINGSPLPESAFSVEPNGDGGATITLVGDACSGLGDGGAHSISFELLGQPN